MPQFGTRLTASKPRPPVEQQADPESPDGSCYAQQPQVASDSDAQGLFMSWKCCFSRLNFPTRGKLPGLQFDCNWIGLLLGHQRIIRSLSPKRLLCGFYQEKRRFTFLVCRFAFCRLVGTKTKHRTRNAKRLSEGVLRCSFVVSRWAVSSQPRPRSTERETRNEQRETNAVYLPA